MACMCLLIARLVRVPSTAATISHDVQEKPSCLQHPGEKHTTWLVRLPRHSLATAPLDVCCTRRGVEDLLANRYARARRCLATGEALTDRPAVRRTGAVTSRIDQ